MGLSLLLLGYSEGRGRTRVSGKRRAPCHQGNLRFHRDERAPTVNPSRPPAPALTAPILAEEPRVQRVSMLVAGTRSGPVTTGVLYHSARDLALAPSELSGCQADPLAVLQRLKNHLAMSIIAPARCLGAGDEGWEN